MESLWGVPGILILAWHVTCEIHRSLEGGVEIL